MNKLPNIALILITVAAFIFGGITSAAIGGVLIRKKAMKIVRAELTNDTEALEKMRERRLKSRDKLIKRVSRKLKLTDEQEAKVEGIILKHLGNTKAAKDEFKNTIVSELKAARAEIGLELTAEQNEKLDEGLEKNLGTTLK